MYVNVCATNTILIGWRKSNLYTRIVWAIAQINHRNYEIGSVCTKYLVGTLYWKNSNLCDKSVNMTNKCQQVSPNTYSNI